MLNKINVQSNDAVVCYRGIGFMVVPGNINTDLYLFITINNEFPLYTLTI